MAQREIITQFDIRSENDFSTFYKTYYGRFVRYAFYYVSDMQAAEDMTHDALLYYWEHKRELADDTDVLGYILITVKNKCLNYLRHIQVVADYESRTTRLHEWEVETRIQTLESESYSKLFTKDIRRIMEESLSELPKETQRIFILNRLKDKSRKEIAEQLGVSPQKVDYHLNKANMHLMKKLKDYLPLLVWWLW